MKWEGTEKLHYMLVLVFTHLIFGLCLIRHAPYNNGLQIHKKNFSN